nr:hypothetical protein [Edaphobacter aggregans]
MRRPRVTFGFRNPTIFGTARTSAGRGSRTFPIYIPKTTRMREGNGLPACESTKSASSNFAS